MQLLGISIIDGEQKHYWYIMNDYGTKYACVCSSPYTMHLLYILVAGMDMFAWYCICLMIIETWRYGQRIYG